MNINQQQIDSLIEMVAFTEDVEKNCDHCLQHMAEFAESELSGKSIQEGIRSIEEHLQRCVDCQQEFSALKEALSLESFD